MQKCVFEFAKKKLYRKCQLKWIKLENFWSQGWTYQMFLVFQPFPLFICISHVRNGWIKVFHCFYFPAFPSVYLLHTGTGWVLKVTLNAFNGRWSACCRGCVAHFGTSSDFKLLRIEQVSCSAYNCVTSWKWLWSRCKYICGRLSFLIRRVPIFHPTVNLAHENNCLSSFVWEQNGALSMSPQMRIWIPYNCLSTLAHCRIVYHCRKGGH